MDKLRLYLWIISLYLALVGLVTFSLFICEEAIQTTMFGLWPASDVKDWKTVRTGLKVMRGINRTLKIVNYSAGWIQPLAFVSYRQYGKATDYYIEGLNAKVFANAPELYIGEEVEFNFRANKSERLADGNCAYRQSKITVIADCENRLNSIMSVKGTMTKKNGRLFVTVMKSKDSGNRNDTDPL